MLDIRKIAGLPNKKEDLISKIKKYDFYVFYGLGWDLELRYENYVSYFGKPRYIVDRAKFGGGYGEVYRDIPVLQDLGEINSDEKWCVIISAPSHTQELVKICQKFLSDEDIIWNATILGSTNANFREFIIENEQTITEFYESLSDQTSKTTFEKWLEGKVTNDANIFCEICMPNNYMNAEFIDEETQKWAGYQTTYPLNLDRTRPCDSYFITGLFEFNEEMIFYDVGTAYGDTIEGFFEYGKPKNGKAVGVELDPNVAQKAREICNTYDYDTQIINAGLSDEEGTVSFSSENVGGGSLDATGHTSDNGDSVGVRIIKLDNLVNETGLIPNLIKMDIEGAEFRALKGASNTIKTHKPILAICMYHKAEDLITIPQYIKKLNPNYKFYLRHFSITASELVLFAV